METRSGVEIGAESTLLTGKLKIFFGYAAGVGKTYAMLEAAHQAQKEGMDVVVGYVEPHARPDTLALLDGLESLPCKEIDYRGIKLKEFDLDRALQRKPQLILVDELAHNNNLLELERNMEALTARQNALLDQVLAHMDDLTITEQLKTLLEEKQHLQARIDAVKTEAANRISEDSRMAELTAYLEEHLSGFQQYDDGIIRQLVERITVVDAETIRIKFRYSDVEIEQTMC